MKQLAFAADNNALEVRSLERSGETKIKEVKAARDAFFNQALFIERGIWDKNLFDGSRRNRFLCFKTVAWRYKVNGGGVRVDFGQTIELDSIKLIVGSEKFLQPLKSTENIDAYVSTDLKTWVPVIMRAGKVIETTIPKGLKVRYLKLDQTPERISEIIGYKNGMFLSIQIVNRVIKPFVVFCFLSLSMLSCHRDSDAWKNEKVEMKRFVKVKLADNFDEPMEMAIMDDGKVMVIERKGAIKLFSPATNSIKKIAAMPVYTGQEDGLLGVVLDPQFSSNHFIYFYYSPNDNQPRQRVSRFVFENDSLLFSSEKVIIEIPTQRQECCHSAGSLAFGPDGNLYIAVGDNTNPHNPGYYNSIDERKGRENWDAQRTAANTNDFRGKILRIHPGA
jgi:hypothetical protein